MRNETNEMYIKALVDRYSALVCDKPNYDKGAFSGTQPYKFLNLNSSILPQRIMSAIYWPYRMSISSAQGLVNLMSHVVKKQNLKLTLWQCVILYCAINSPLSHALTLFMYSSCVSSLWTIIYLQNSYY